MRNQTKGEELKQSWLLELLKNKQNKENLELKLNFRLKEDWINKPYKGRGFKLKLQQNELLNKKYWKDKEFKPKSKLKELQGKKQLEEQE